MRARYVPGLLAVCAGLALGFALSYMPDASAARNASGTYSLPSGNPVVSGTTISATTHNNTMSDVATELTNSLDRNGRGAMLAPLQHSSGTAAAPGVTFSADTDCGLYRVSTNTIGMSAAGAQVQSWSSTGSTVTAQTVTGNEQVSGALMALDGGVFQTHVANGPAVSGTGNGSGSGISGTGGATGAGVTGTGGASGNVGGSFTGTGTSAGVSGTGAAGKPGGSFVSGTAATATAPQVAAELTNGYLSLDSAANPASDAGFGDTLTPTNIPKAWGYFQCTGSNGANILAGFNILSIGDQGQCLRVTLTRPMASTAYAPFVSSASGSSKILSASVASSSTFDVCAYSDDGTQYDISNSVNFFSVMVMGAQ